MPLAVSAVIALPSFHSHDTYLSSPEWSLPYYLQKHRKILYSLAKTQDFQKESNPSVYLFLRIYPTFVFRVKYNNILFVDARVQTDNKELGVVWK